MPEALRGDPVAEAIIGHHTSPREAGAIFTETRPRMAAFTHIVEIGKAGVACVPLEAIEAATRTTYDGPLVVGEDLMRFTVSADGVVLGRTEPS